MAKKKREKVSRFDNILTAFWDFMEEYYPEIYSKELRTEFPAVDLVEVMDKVLEEGRQFREELAKF